MDTTTAVRALGALAQESRLAAFRLLVRAGDRGLPAGEIARALAIPHNTLSTHLAALAQGGLVRSRRDGRSIIYSVDFAGTRALLAFLLEDCCRGAPEICSPALDSVLAVRCPTEPEGDPDRETTAR
jgi:ArsR family transcriptional regulator